MSSTPTWSRPTHRDEAPRLLLTAREAAAALRVSERTLFTWSKEGRLPVVRLGGCVRYDESDLRRLIEACKTPAGKGTSA